MGSHSAFRRIYSFSMWCCVTGLVVRVIWTDCSVGDLQCRRILLRLCNSWRRRYRDPLKCWNHWQNVTSHNSLIPNVHHSVRTSVMLASLCNFLHKLLVVVDLIKEFFTFIEPEWSLPGTWDIVHWDKFNLAVQHVSTQAVVKTGLLTTKVRQCTQHCQWSNFWGSKHVAVVPRPPFSPVEGPLSTSILYGRLRRVTIPVAVIIQFVLLEMSKVLLETCWGL